MQSYLVVGGIKEERLEKAEKVSSIKYRVSSIDKIILEAENSIGINQIRSLQHQLHLKPYNSDGKVAIIPEAERLTIPAQNAMLKLLEEPPKNTIIILCSQNPDLLLPTIVSRCQVIRLPSKSQLKISNLPASRDSFRKAGVGERIKMAGEIAKNRESAVEFCQAQLIIWREQMLKVESRKQKAESVKVLREIQRALRMIEANVNPKLTLENLLLQYPTK